MKPLICGLMLCLVPGAASAFELSHAFAPKAPSASLLESPDPIPASMRTALGGRVFDELSLNAEGFTNSLARTDLTTGGGAGMGPDSAWLAFLLGFFPGFGLGHFVVAGRPGIGTRWLIIDIVFLVAWIVLDAVVGAAYGGYYCDRYGCSGGWGLWWILFDLVFPVGWVVEHVFQGLSAYRMTAGRSPFANGQSPAEGQASLPLTPAASGPRQFAFSF